MYICVLKLKSIFTFNECGEIVLDITLSCHRSLINSANDSDILSLTFPFKNGNNK